MFCSSKNNVIFAYQITLKQNKMNIEKVINILDTKMFFNKHNLFFESDKGAIIISNDINQARIYVDENHRKITEPIYETYFIGAKGKRLYKMQSKSIRESNLDKEQLVIELNLLHEAYFEKRKNKLINEFNYRRKIQSMKPINYVLNGDVTLTMFTECVYYSGGHVSKNKGSFEVTKKQIKFLINGKLFYNNSMVVDIDFNVDNNFLVSIIQNINGANGNDIIKDVSSYQSVYFDIAPLPKRLILGQTFLIKGELLTILDANICGSHQTKTDRFTVKNHTKNITDTISIDKVDLCLTNVTQLCPEYEINVMTTLIILTNKLKFC